MTQAGQYLILKLLKKDHGPYTAESVLDRHPLAQELDLKQGAIIATFEDCRFAIRHDGTFSPLPTPKPEKK